MGNNYVDLGYVELGYVEGDVVTLAVGKHPISFFVSSNTKTEEEVKTEVMARLNTDEVAIVYIPEVQKIILGTNGVFTEFLGGFNIQDILSDTTFISKVQELSAVSLTATITDATGNTLASATVTQTSPTQFRVTVPPELVGTDYFIELG